jgi:hypothetical protein
MKSLPQHSNNWDKLTPPLRPTPAVAEQMSKLSLPGPTLLFGVTPELHAVYSDLLAIDSNPDMIQHVWPGDTLSKSAQISDWNSMQFDKNSFSCIVGDGAITMLDSIDNIISIQARAYDWLKPGGTFVHRLFECPEHEITAEHLIGILSSPATINWNAFKLLMMYYQAQNNCGRNILSSLLKLFNKMVPNREAVALATGWSLDAINTVDFYAGIDTITFKPTRSGWIDMVPPGAINLKFYKTSGYDLAEYCPIMVWEKS